MWHCLFFILIVSACGLFYLSHKNQQWLAHPLNPRIWRPISYLCLAVALFGEWHTYTVSSAIALWLVMIMFVAGLLPFMTLIRSRKTS